LQSLVPVECPARLNNDYSRDILLGHGRFAAREAGAGIRESARRLKTTRGLETARRIGPAGRNSPARGLETTGRLEATRRLKTAPNIGHPPTPGRRARERIPNVGQA